MDIALNFINNSNDSNNSQIVIFQKNVAANFDELAVAWKVIQNCAPGDNHPFTLPMGMTVGASDSFGNYTPQRSADHGQLIQFMSTKAGDQLVAAGSASNASELQVQNGLQKGAINACIYKSGGTLALKVSIAPQQTAVFQFKPTIWIGVASQVVQGQVMDSAILSNINTELSLLGIASADIVMTGGGAGASASPFQFNLQNIEYA